MKINRSGQICKQFGKKSFVDLSTFYQSCWDVLLSSWVLLCREKMSLSRTQHNDSILQVECTSSFVTTVPQAPGNSGELTFHLQFPAITSTLQGQPACKTKSKNMALPALRGVDTNDWCIELVILPSSLNAQSTWELLHILIFATNIRVTPITKIQNFLHLSKIEYFYQKY